ncbi:hypothetical protein HZB94_00300 [Candidatus Falkowbacteria bacterium]|nr:hypothetical protein [Candidatus Falkowbacteria bacterium]
MPSLCEQIKTEYEQLQNLKEQLVLEYEKVKDSNDMKDWSVVKKLQVEWEHAYANLEKKLYVSVERARELLGRENVLGPEEIENAFGFKVSEADIPPIPYNPAELEKARELGEQLVLRISQDSDGNPMTMKRINEIMQPRMDVDNEGKLLHNTDWCENEGFYQNDSLRTEWRLIGGSFVPDVTSAKDKEGRYTKGSTNNNYVHQTRLLRGYLKSIDSLTEAEGQECSDEKLRRFSEQMGVDWDSQEITDEEKYNENWREVAGKLR